MSENPVDAAREAYRRAHPRQADAVDEAMSLWTEEDSEPEVIQRPAADEDTGSGQLFDSAAARAAGEAGMAQAERAARVQRWKAAAEAWVRDLPVGAEVVADDVVAALGLPDPSAGPASNNVIGAIFSSLSRAEVLTFTGRFKTSERVIGHGNLQRVWRRT